MQGDLSAFDDSLATTISTSLKSLETLSVLHTSQGSDSPLQAYDANETNIPASRGPAVGFQGLYELLANLSSLKRLELEGCPRLMGCPSASVGPEKVGAYRAHMPLLALIRWAPMTHMHPRSSTTHKLTCAHSESHTVPIGHTCTHAQAQHTRLLAH